MRIVVFVPTTEIGLNLEARLRSRSLSHRTEVLVLDERTSSCNRDRALSKASSPQILIATSQWELHGQVPTSIDTVIDSGLTAVRSWDVLSGSWTVPVRQSDKVGARE